MRVAITAVVFGVLGVTAATVTVVWGILILTQFLFTVLAGGI